MFTLGPLGFVAPWLLVALVALPALWFILRALPPAPRTIRFPGVGLLAGLKDPHPVAQRTPWWLLILRLLAMAALIVGLAGPVWKPAAEEGADLPLLIVVDSGWAAAPEWSGRQARVLREIERAGAVGQPVALLLADGRAEGALPFLRAGELAARMRAALPVAWNTRYPGDPAAALANAPRSGLRSLWFSDGLDHPGRAEWLTALAARGPVTVLGPSLPVQSLELDRGTGQPLLLYRTTGDAPPPAIRAIGPDPQGVLRELAQLTPAAPRREEGVTTRPVPVDLPSELRNRITRFEIEAVPSAGVVVLADDRVRRRKVALVGDDRATEGQELLSPMHYLREAIAPGHDLISGGLADVLPAAPDVIVLVDRLGADGAGLEEWVSEGGLLIRFAGPRMAASQDLSREPLLPLRLRDGGRDVGGALSWGEPRGIAPFDADGPFAGLAVPEEVSVRAQLLPEPAPDLGRHVIARLSDQTPLVSRDRLGQGQVVLFHTTANAEWSSLPLSGLFVQMLDRLIQTARLADGEAAPDPTEGSYWSAEMLLDGFGRATPPEGLSPVAHSDFMPDPSQPGAAARPGPDRPAGIYVSGEQRQALNAGGALSLPEWPGATVERAGSAGPGTPLMRWLIALAAVLLALDAFGSALLAGGRRKERTS